MPSHYLETQIEMYRKVQAFSKTYSSTLQEKNVQSISRRFAEHDTELNTLSEVYAHYNKREFTDVIDRVNLRFEEMQLAYDIVHTLSLAHYDIPDDDSLEMLLNGMYNTKTTQDPLFCNYVSSFLKYLPLNGEEKPVPQKMLNDLNIANQELAGLLENTGVNQADKTTSVAELLGIVRSMDDRLHILDRLMLNYCESDPGLCEAYRQARIVTLTPRFAYPHLPNRRNGGPRAMRP